MTKENNVLANERQIDLARVAPFRLGAVEVRPQTREVSSPEGTQSLEPRIMQALVAFSRAQNQFVTRDDLIACCWSGRIVGEDAINRVISKLHRLAKLDGGRSFQLETIRGVGYRMTVRGEGTGSDDAGPAHEGGPPRRRRLGVALAAVLAVSIAAGGIAWLSLRDRAAPTRVAAEQVIMAVLPFDSLTADPSRAFLAEGLTREIRNDLSRVRGLRVIADASSFAAAAANPGAVAVGRRLNADYLLDGSVRASGRMVRITTELIDARTGVQLWAASHEDDAGNLFSVQDAVSAAVIQELAARLGEHVQAPVAARRRHPEAFRLVLQARHLMRENLRLRQSGRLDEALDASEQAVELANAALAIDPNEVGALLLIGNVRLMQDTRELARAPRTAAQRQAEYAAYLQRALATDPNDPEALTALGEHLRRNALDWRQAEALFRRALAIDPSLAEAHVYYAYELSTLGRCLEALQHARLAVQLDPLRMRLVEPRVMTCAGQRAESQRLYDRYIAEAPDNVFLLREIYLKLLVEGDPAALRALERRVRRDLWRGRPPPLIDAGLKRVAAAADALEGRPAELLALVEAEAEVASRTPEPQPLAQRGRYAADVRWTLAMEFAWAGRPARALDELEAAVAAGSVYIPDTLPYGRSEFPPPVRDDPRYAALWREDPRLAELVRLRLKALKDGQMEGRLPDGRVVSPPAGAART